MIERRFTVRICAAESAAALVGKTMDQVINQGLTRFFAPAQTTLP